MRSKQNIILLTEPSKSSWETPSKIGNLFMNRFSIDEDNACEVLGVYHLTNAIPYDEGYDELKDKLNVISDSIRRGAKYRFGDKLEEIHLVFAQNDGDMDERHETFDEISSNWMKSFRIKTLIVTLLTMTRLDMVSEHRMNTLRKTPLEYMESVSAIPYHQESLFDYDLRRNKKKIIGEPFCY